MMMMVVDTPKQYLPDDDHEGGQMKSYSDLNISKTNLVTWCFTPSQPLRLYQGDQKRKNSCLTAEEKKIIPVTTDQQFYVPGHSCRPKTRF